MSASSIRLLAILHILSIPVPALCRSTAREEAELLARAGEAEFRLAVLRAGDAGGAAGPELAGAMRSLEEARELDGANLRALTFLGLVRLEAGRLGRGKTPAFDRIAFDSMREPLEELFELSEGWADPATRELLHEVKRHLDGAFAAPGASPGEAVTWWREWREAIPGTEERPARGAEVTGYVETLRTSRYAWEREKAIEQIVSRPARGPAAAEALAEALREDDSPWVRAAAARAMGKLRPSGWDLLLAGALMNDSSAWVRRSAASALSSKAVRKVGTSSGPDAALRSGTLRSTSDGAGRPRGPVALRPAALGALRAALASDTPRVAAAAARSLGALGEEKELVSALDAPSPLVREAAALALRAPVSEEIKAKLRSLLEDPDDRVRFAAVCALLPAGDSRVLDELRSFSESAVPLDNDHSLGFDTIGGAARRLLDTLEKTRRRQ